MARHGDRRGFTAPQRSPEELVQRLAELAASTGGPTHRHGRRVPGAAPSIRETVPSARRPTLPTGGDDVSSESPAPKTADLHPGEASAPEPRLEAPAPSPVIETRAPVARDGPLTPSPATEAPARRSPESDSPPPPQAIGPTSRQAGSRRDIGLVIGTPLGEASGVRLGDRARSPKSKSRASNGASVGTRFRSRAAGRVRQPRRLSAAGSGLLGGGGRRLRTPRPRSAGADARSRKLRRLYAPLLLILAVVIVVGLLDKGKGQSTEAPAHRGSPSRSVFPTPSTIPTVAQPAPIAPTVNTPPAAVTTTVHKSSPAKRANRHAAAHAKAHKSSHAASTPPPALTTSAPASQPTSVAPYIAPSRASQAPPTPDSAGSSLSGRSLVGHRHPKKHQ